MIPSVLIFPVFNFFRRNIWHSIFDQFHFQHIFWDEMTVSSDNTGKEKWQLKAAETFLGTIWMVFWEKNIWRHSWWGNKYLYFSYLNFTMKGVTVKKAILRFFLTGISYVTTKNFNLDRPPLHVFCPDLQDFWQISDADIFHWIFGYLTIS